MNCNPYSITPEQHDMLAMASEWWSVQVFPLSSNEEEENNRRKLRIRFKHALHKIMAEKFQKYGIVFILANGYYEPLILEALKESDITSYPTPPREVSMTITSDFEITVREGYGARPYKMLNKQYA